MHGQLLESEGRREQDLELLHRALHPNRRRGGRRQQSQQHLLRRFPGSGVSDVRLRGNRFTDAIRNGCAVAGIGASAIRVDGAIGARVENNFIKGWKTEDAQTMTTGIAVVDDPCSFPSLSCEGVGIPAVARNNLVKGNTLDDNDLDISVETSGPGNEFRRNRCDTSNKAGVCKLQVGAKTS